MTEKTEPNTEEKAAPAPAAAISDEHWKTFAAKHADTDGVVDEGEPEPGAQESAAEDRPEEVKETPKPEPESKEASQDADPLWAKADKDPKTAALKAAWEAAPATARPAIEQAQRDRLERGQEIARLRTTVSSFKRTEPAPAKAAAPEEAKGATPKDTIPALDSPDWAKFEEDFPEAAKWIKASQRRVDELESRLQPKLGELEAATKNHSAVIDEIEVDKQGRLLHEEIPHYAEVVKTKGFREAFDDWLPLQTKAIQEMAERNGKYVVSANEASTVFRLFTADTGFGAEAKKEPPAKSPGEATATPPANGKRRLQQAAAAAVTSKGPGTPSSGDPNDGEYWWKHWASKRRDSEAAIQ